MQQKTEDTTCGAVGRANRMSALKWWNSITPIEKFLHYRKYIESGVFTMAVSSVMLTGSEIEEIYTKLHENEKVNQKQFKEFNVKLFVSYVNKFSDEDKGMMFRVLFDETPNKDKHIDGFTDNFYMAICRAFNAGKQSMLEQRDGRPFLSSDSYYIKEFK